MKDPSVITRKVLFCLGLSQLTCWGITFYMMGVFGEPMTADLGWSRSVVFGGFSAALLVMGVVSPAVGRAIDEYGGRPVMVCGSVLTAGACVLLSVSGQVATFYAAWVCLGVSMRMTLYDAAFASLARVVGPQAKRPISQITLLGGLASTTFWPIGHFLIERLGWRSALLVYAGISLLTVLLHLTIPRERYQPPAETSTGAEATGPETGRGNFAAGVLYALIVTMVTFLNSGMSSHMIGILGGLGVSAAAAVWVSTLRGIGQSLARLGEILFGGRLHPLSLCVFAASLLPISFFSGLFSGYHLSAAVVFSLLYGAGNGLMTIVRGTLPLVIFDTRTYGGLVGRLLVPSFFLSALAPLVYAVVIDGFGDRGGMILSLLIGAAIVLASLGMRRLNRRRG